MSLHQLSPAVWQCPQFCDSSECHQLLTLAQTQGFQAAGVRTGQGMQAMPNIRNNERLVLSAPAWVSMLWQRLQTLSLPVLEGELACGLPHELRFYKYAPGQRFKMHKDGHWEENGLRSKLTFLLYLNADFEGGATKFRDFSVQPVTGSALLFVHATWHEGEVVSAGEKYVLRSDILYAPPAAGGG